MLSPGAQLGFQFTYVVVTPPSVHDTLMYPDCRAPRGPIFPGCNASELLGLDPGHSRSARRDAPFRGP